MGLLTVFDEIVAIMHHDYSGFQDKKGWDHPEFFRERLVQLELAGQLTRHAFETVVNDYLYDFKDEHNGIRSIHQEAPPQTVGFKVRRYQDKLYVIEVTEEARLKKGDAIIELDGVPISEVAAHSKRELRFHTTDRENWDSVLLNTDEVTLQNGSTLSLQKVELIREPSKYECLWIDDIPVLQFNDFTNHAEMAELLEKHESQLKQTKNWIIDVRRCRGGSDSVYFPIFNYLFPPGFKDLDVGKMTHVVTERNYQNRMRSLKEFKQQSDPFIDTFLNQMETNRGKLFVEFDFGDFDDAIEGTLLPEKMVVLTDKFCGSSGEQFVVEASLSPKVVTMGRPTRGVLDYSNQAFERFEEDGYEFFYATSRSDRVDKGTGIDFYGFQPDILIPWSPEHISQDIDIEQAIQHLKK